MKQPILLLSLVSFLFVLSCQSSRRTIKQPLKEYGASYLLEEMKNNELKFNTFSSKFNVVYSIQRQKGDIKGQLRLVRDSALWINLIQEPGIEIFRILITPDSVKMLDRISKKYFASDYTFLNNLLEVNIDFDILQSLILGNDLENYDPTNFRASVDQQQYRLNTTGRRKFKKAMRNHHDQQRTLFQTIWLDPQTFKITEVKLREISSANKKLTAKYSAFITLDGQLFPAKTEFIIETDQKTKVTIRHSKVTINEPVIMPFQIPENYQK